MARRSRSAWSVVARFSIIAVLLTVLVHGGTVAYVYYRAELSRSEPSPPAADQIVAIAEALGAAETLEAEARLLRALNSPYLILQKLAPGDAAASERPGLASSIMQSFIDARLAGDPPPEIAFVFVDRDRTDGPRIAPLLPFDEQVMNADLTLPDGRRFRLVTDSPFLSLGWVSRLFGNSLFLLAIVLGATLFVIRRLVAPLDRFADASEAFAADIDSPPLEESRGAREVRRAAHAFNRMQARLRRLIEERTLMLASISHDMRTVVTRWELRAETMADPALRERSIRDARELRAMLTQFLDFAQASGGALETRRIDLASLAQSVCDEFQEELRAAGAQETTTEAEMRVACLESAARPIVELDPTALKRILRNLISNACRYGERARIRIDETPDAAVIEIWDAGPGLPPDRLDELMRPFTRLEGSRSRETGGMGLGLSIVRTLVDRLGAEIAFENPPEGGLRVRLTAAKRRV